MHVSLIAAKKNTTKVSFSSQGITEKMLFGQIIFSPLGRIDRQTKRFIE